MNVKRLGDTRRVEYLDGLRGVAALVVLIGHSWMMFSQPISSYSSGDGVAAIPAMLLKVVGLVANGNSAVCIFFLLSGFVLADFARGATISFPAQVVRRYLRLAIPILITSTFAYCLLRFGLFRNAESARIFGEWAGAWYQFDASFTAMTYEALVGTFATGSNAYNSNLWTMHPEMVGSFYILLINAIPATRRWRTALYGCLIAVHLFDYLPLFAVGALLREYEVEVHRLGRMPWLPAALCLFGLYLCTLPDVTGGKLELVYPLPKFSFDNTRIWHSIGATLLLGGVLTSSSAQQILASPVAKSLGRISFTLYLIHVPILCSLGAWLIVELATAGNATAAAIGLPVVLLVCLGSSVLLTPVVDVSAVRVSRRVGYWLDEMMTDSRSSTARRPPEFLPLADDRASSAPLS
ncbi:acyltransferase family protein [Bradyrhizobium sp. HKCCYLR20261]|uniref:acyltransferase family protein n=1 Tax=Bradyrhizobium sp. HKCCYLR20261 TaxID=3420760 RepID=UPI003EBA9DEE